MLIFSAGIFLGGYGLQLYSISSTTLPEYDNIKKFEEYDYNNDKLTDTKWVFTKEGLPVQSYSDRNFDGKFDEIIFYDENGMIKKSKTDDNFDGKFETVIYIDSLTNSYSETDINMDGNIDIVSSYKNSLLQETRYLQEGSKIPIKIEHYENGLIKSAELDRDKDGKMDTRHTYNDINEIEKTETIE